MSNKIDNETEMLFNNIEEVNETTFEEEKPKIEKVLEAKKPTIEEVIKEKAQQEGPKATQAELRISKALEKEAKSKNVSINAGNRIHFRG